MDAKLNHSELSALLAKQTDLSAAKAENFTKAFFDIIIEGLESDGTVKINGLGTFKITDVASRESVDVNTGEKIEIKGHKKLTFQPADALKESVNQPFAMFEPVEIDDSYIEEEESESSAEEELVNGQVEESIALTEEKLVEETPAATEEPIAEVAEEPALQATAPCETNEATEEAPVAANEESVAEIPTENIEVSNTEPVEEPAAVEKTTEQPSPAEDAPAKKKSAAWIFALLLATVCVVGYFTYTSLQSANKIDESLTVQVEAVVPAVELVPAVQIDTTEVAEDEIYTFLLVEELAGKSVGSVGIGDTLLYYADGTMETHTVAEDETLTRIALKYYGDKRLWPYIVQHNDLRNPNGLAKGMELAIPRLKPSKQPAER